MCLGDTEAIVAVSFLPSVWWSSGLLLGGLWGDLSIRVEESAAMSLSSRSCILVLGDITH